MILYGYFGKSKVEIIRVILSLMFNNHTLYSYKFRVQI